MTKDLPPLTTLTEEHVRAIRECADEVWNLLKDPHWRFADDRSIASYMAARAQEAARLIEQLLANEAHP